MDDITNSSEYKEFTFLDKLKKNPTVVMGLVGLSSIVAYGLYNIKNKGTMKTSVYLIHLRLAAQGAMVGCLTLGLLIAISQKNLGNLFKKKN